MPTPQPPNRPIPNFAVLNKRELTKRTPCRRFGTLVTHLNKALEEKSSQASDALKKERLGMNLYVQRIVDALKETIDPATSRNKMLCSKGMTWLAVLGSFFKLTCDTMGLDDATRRWHSHIKSALLRNCISWVLGNTSQTITATIVQELLLSNAIELKRGPELSESGWGMTSPKRRKPTRIDFGCKFPLREGLPPDLSQGFNQLLENSNHMTARPGSPITTAGHAVCWRSTCRNPRSISCACWLSQ